MPDFESFSLGLSGDSLITRRVSIYEDEPTRRLIERLRGCDAAFTNMEILPNNFQGYPVQESGGVNLAAHDWVIDELTGMGFDLFSAATNHSLDYAIAGLLSTMEILDAKGVCYAGVGRNLTEARMPAYLETPAGSVALISCASSFGTGQQASMQRPEMPGRPGLNPIRYETTYRVTPDQLNQIRAIAEQTGLHERWQRMVDAGFRKPPEDPDSFRFLNADFKASDEPGIETRLREDDIEDIAGWVRDARLRADLVIVSYHGHEPGNLFEEPEPFQEEFARRMIDEGADVFVGHGPHILRGMEIYDGKPIFYSLGNFIFQNELVHKVPSDAYERVGADPLGRPTDMVKARTSNFTRGFPAEKRFWESVVPILHFTGGKVSRVELLPVSLGFGNPSHRRGRPWLAAGNEAAEILARFAELSSPFGVEVAIDGDVGWVSV